jgi:hypothetical protein
MPVALERKLKKQVAGKKMSKDRKDAYVYGTLRKTGWKPKREKKMSNTQKLIRLSEINHDLDSVIQFDYYDQRQRSLAGDVALVGGGAATIGGGYLAHRGIQKAGGYGKFAQQAGLGYDIGKAAGAGKNAVGIGEAAGQFGKTFGKAPGAALGTAAGIGRAKIGSAAAGLWKRIKNFFEDPEKPIEFDGIMGNKEHTSKIDQLEFPAGLSPAAALQFPLPVLMRYLNQRNLLQQQFSRKERLVQLSAKLDGINFAVPPGAERFNKAYDEYKRDRTPENRSAFARAAGEWTESPEFKERAHDTRKKLLIGGGTIAGLGAVGAATHGFYRKGLGVQVSNAERRKLGGTNRGVVGNIRKGASRFFRGV